MTPYRLPAERPENDRVPLVHWADVAIFVLAILVATSFAVALVFVEAAP